MPPALLTEIREPKTGGGWTSSYEVHPIVRELVEQHSDRTEALHQEGHRRAGDHLELEAHGSPSWQNILEGAYHLRQIGEADRAYDLLEPVIGWLQERGRMLDSLGLLAEIGDPASLHPSRTAWVSTFHGDAAVAYGDLTQALGNLPAALESYQASHDIFERRARADPGNAGWQRDLAFSHWRLARYGNQSRFHGQKVVSILRELEKQGRLAPADQKLLPIAEDNLAASTQ